MGLLNHRGRPFNAYDGSDAWLRQRLPCSRRPVYMGGL